MPLTDTVRKSDDYPWARSEARQLLAAALERLQRERGVTQREIARQLGYKASVVLSHMALGRVPIPIDRAADIATALDLNYHQFLVATLKQRFPDIDFEGLFGVEVRSQGHLASELEQLAGRRLDDLPAHTADVLREVAYSEQPGRRWLSLPELTAVEALRARFPRLRSDGLSKSERELLNRCIREASGATDVD